jgi:hypothetical protein
LSSLALICAVMNDRQAPSPPAGDLGDDDRAVVAVAVKSHKPDRSSALLDTTVVLCAERRTPCIDRRLLTSAEPGLSKSADGPGLLAAFISRNEEPWRIGGLDVGLRAVPAAQVAVMFATGRGWRDVEAKFAGVRNLVPAFVI